MPRIAARRVMLIAVIVTLGIFALDLVGLDTPSLWLDETFSVGLAQQPYHVMALYLWGIEPNMELYYLVLHVWLGIAGLFGGLPIEVVARLPSVAAAALAGGVLFAFGQRFWGATAGFVAVVVYALSTYQLTYAQQARSYSMAVLFVTVASFAFMALLRGLARPGWWWTVFGLASVLGFYTHLFTVFVLAAQLVAFVALLIIPSPVRARTRRLVQPMLICLVVMVHLSLPMILVARNGGHTSWIAPVPLSDLFAVFRDDVSGGSVLYLALLTALVALLGLVVLLSHLPQTRHLFDNAVPTPSAGLGTLVRAIPAADVIVLSSWLIVPLALSFVLTQSWLNLHLFLARYEIVVLPAISLLVGVAVSAFRATSVQVALALALLGLGASTIPSYYPQAQIQDFRSASAWLETSYRPGDGIACFPLYECAKPINVYLGADGGAAHMDPNSPGGNDWRTARDLPVTVSTVTAYAKQHTRVFLVSAPLTASPDTLATGAAITHFLDTTYRLVATYHSHTVTVSLYDTSTRASHAP